jgi:hypothetical protein
MTETNVLIGTSWCSLIQTAIAAQLMKWGRSFKIHGIARVGRQWIVLGIAHPMQAKTVPLEQFFTLQHALRRI